MTLEEILNEIEKQTDISREELLQKVDQKCEQLSGLITKEGAAYLIARELGVNLPEEKRKQLQIKNIVPGMRNVSVIGRIIKISPINEFEVSGKKGRVVNLFVADDTGYFRLPLWNDQVKLVEEEAIRLGDTIQIFNGISKENIFGDIEISLGKFGGIKQVEVELPSVEELTKKFLSFVPEKTLIRNIVPGKNFEIRATIVHVFKGNFLFDVCSICGDKLIQNKCQEHGEVEPSKALVISCVVDDSTSSIRAVFFRELAERIITTQVSELASLDSEKRYELIKERLLGKELILIGKVKKNKIFNRLELIVNEVKDLNALEESKKLVEALELKVS